MSVETWHVESGTRRDVFYEVSYGTDTGRWACSCPFIPRKDHPYCKHILGQQAAVVAGVIKLPNAALAEEWNVLTQPGGVRGGALDQAKENMARVLAEHGGPRPDDGDGAVPAEDVEVPLPAADGVGEPAPDEEGVAADPHELPSGYTVQQQLEAERRAAEETLAVVQAFEQAGQSNPVVPVSNIDTAILAVYAEVEYVQKQRAEKLGYSFAGEAAIIQALRPALVRHGITVHIDKLGTPVRERYETKSGGLMVSTILKGRVVFTHAPSGTKRKVWAWGEGSDAGDKSIPKAHTGLYKYALRQTFNLETGDDPDLQSSRDQQRANDVRREERENRQARRDVLSRAGGGDLPDWWQWFISERNQLGLVAADFASVLAGNLTPPRVQSWLDEQEPRPTSKEDISAALNRLLSRVADLKAKGQA